MVFIWVSGLPADLGQQKRTNPQNLKVINDYLALKVSKCRVAGPFQSAPPDPTYKLEVLGSFPKKVNLVNGALLWICHPLGGLV